MSKKKKNKSAGGANKARDQKLDKLHEEERLNTAGEGQKLEEASLAGQAAAEALEEGVPTSGGAEAMEAAEAGEKLAEDAANAADSEEAAEEEADDDVEPGDADFAVEAEAEEPAAVESAGEEETSAPATAAAEGADEGNLSREELAARVKSNAEEAVEQEASQMKPRKPRRAPSGARPRKGRPGRRSTAQQQRGGGPIGGGGPAAMVPGEKAKDFKGTMKKLLAYLGGYVPAIIACIVLVIASTVFAIWGPKIMAGATDELMRGMLAMITGSGGIDFTLVGRILLTCAGLYVISAVLQYVQGFLLTGIANKVSYRMRSELSEKINKLPLSYYDHESYGNVLSRITNDVDTLTTTMTQSLPQLISGVTTVIGILIMMLTMNVWMALITLLILPVSLVLVIRIVKHSQPYYMQQQDFLGEANGQVEETYGGHLVIKAFNHEKKSNEEFAQVNEKLYKAAWKSQFFGGMMMPVMNLVSNIGYVIVCIVGGFFVLTGATTVGGIQAFIVYVRNFTQPITQIANASNVMQQTAAAAERVFNFLGEEEEEPDPAEPVQPDGLEGSVYFAHVSFGYSPEKTIIHDFSAIVEPGKMVAIVGPTGAGKTTMVKLLMRFYDVDTGAILIDEYNVRQFARNDLRGMFGMVLQDTWLYNDTIMENIRYGRLDATDEEVIAAAKAAQADRFIRTLPDGYQMVLNEEASNISQGQKQLLTIARTILADPKIMILDEATSSVDTRTEIAIQKAMKTLMEGRTAFVIAHRLSTIRDADMILVMRDGDIVETGTHTELLARGGFYAELYNSQFETGVTA